MTSHERLQSLCDRTGKMEESIVRRTQIRSLEQKTLDEPSELSLLQEIISQAQARQGIARAAGNAAAFHAEDVGECYAGQRVVAEVGNGDVAGRRCGRERGADGHTVRSEDH